MDSYNLNPHSQRRHQASIPHNQGYSIHTQGPQAFPSTAGHSLPADFPGSQSMGFTAQHPLVTPSHAAGLQHLPAALSPALLQQPPGALGPANIVPGSGMEGQSLVMLLNANFHRLGSEVQDLTRTVDLRADRTDRSVHELKTELMTELRTELMTELRTQLRTELRTVLQSWKNEQVNFMKMATDQQLGYMQGDMLGDFTQAA